MVGLPPGYQTEEEIPEEGKKMKQERGTNSTSSRKGRKVSV